MNSDKDQETDQKTIKSQNDFSQVFNNHVMTCCESLTVIVTERSMKAVKGENNRWELRKLKANADWFATRVYFIYDYFVW